MNSNVGFIIIKSIGITQFRDFINYYNLINIFKYQNK